MGAYLTNLSHMDRHPRADPAFLLRLRSIIPLLPLFFLSLSFLARGYLARKWKISRTYVRVLQYFFDSMSGRKIGREREKERDALFEDVFPRSSFEPVSSNTSNASPRRIYFQSCLLEAKKLRDGRWRMFDDIAKLLWWVQSFSTPVKSICGSTFEENYFRGGIEIFC